MPDSDALALEPASSAGANRDAAASSHDKDSLYILPLSLIPLQTPGLRRARMIKDARLESVIELFRDEHAGSGVLYPDQLGQAFDWPPDEVHPDLVVIRGLATLNSYDVYSLRIELRRLKIKGVDADALRLSEEKNRELTRYMTEFTRPLIQQIYGSAETSINDVNDLISMFSRPDKAEALKNLRRMADKLEIEMEEVPTFLEDYGDIFMSLAYFREALDELVPMITEFTESLAELRGNYQLQQDRRFITTAESIEKTFNDIITSITGRFESFDRHSRNFWNNITAESFRKVKIHISAHHTTVGGVLCGLKVKMSAWADRFSDDRGGPIQRSDFIMSEIRQGVEAISRIEAAAPSITDL